MTMRENTNADVIVVGAGPTGLLLASELALQGVRVTVLERLDEPDTTIKAGSISVASAEILDRRGLLPAAQAAQRRMMESVGAFAGASASSALTSHRFPVVGHFAGMFFRPDLVDQTDPVLSAHTAVADGVVVAQREVEQLLAEHCARLGVEIRRGVEVTGVRSAHSNDVGVDDDVIVETSAGDIEAGWLVAADGGRSVVRKQLGIEFDGTDPQLVGYQAIADIDDPTGLRRGWNWTPNGVYSYGPIPGRILVARFGPQPADRNAQVTLDELQQAVREVTGLDVTLTGLHGRATRWSDNARQARSYRRGRILLAGDAAHVHSPFSGQGLNLGLGDAVNLGWKLAATIRGRAPEGLLDTYEAERHPIAAWVLDWTRAQVALMRGDEWTKQLRRVVGDELFTVPGAMNKVVALTAGITQHYDVGDGDARDARDARDAGDAGAGRRVGSIVGDEPLTGGSRLADHAHDGRFVLVDRSPDGRFAAGTKPWASRMAIVSDPAPDSSRPSLLVRPDGVIVWAGLQDHEAAASSLALALDRWAGRP
ncbi:FAD-dependent oxidoreductase [Frondihabitans sp. PAMC 28766]|uniref:FAD-dependent oxidoreductase n=1 Tax=Frondihabitans sp. PAMC 28766 TaxID=1795630 RepID=UPI00078E0838|nr:FAD-dependent oxidoreductase [Frondihabitans sp. PAMC 28766]AMM20769.1 FAD-dependent oxidoreductase [Frondihabitans sp. PAMC 28766]